MRTFLIAILTSSILAGFAGVAVAQQVEGTTNISESAVSEPSGHHVEAALKGSGLKLVRGIANIGLGWIDFPKQAYLIGRKEGWVRGLTRGPIDGLGMLVARTVAGAYEVLTFPVPVPPNYEPLVRPDYVWQPDTSAE